MERKNMKKITEEIRQQGRNGDTVLAHINPKEAALLRLIGGSNTINPNTGLPEFYFDSYDSFFTTPSFSDFYAPYVSPPVYEPPTFTTPSFSDVYSSPVSPPVSPPIYQPPTSFDPYGGAPAFTPVTLPTYESPPLPVVYEPPPPVVFEAPSPIVAAPEVGPVDPTVLAGTSKKRRFNLLVGIAANFIAPGIGSALTGMAASTLTAQIVGSAVVQGLLSETQGGDFLDGAIRGAVSVGVAPAVANTVGTTVADVLADSAVKNVVSNAVASSAASAVAAGLTGGDVDQAALTGALAGAGGSVGRELGTAAELGTTPFSEQTQMLAGQEQGLGTSGGLGANIGQAVGAIASGSEAEQAILQALFKTAVEELAATPKTIEENISQTPVSPPPEAEITTAPPSETGQILDIGVMDGVAGTIPEITPPFTQEIPIPDQISQELGGVQEGIAETIPPLDQDIIDLITQPPATEENLALDVLGEPLTPEAVDIEPIPQDPLLGLSSPAVGEGEQEAIDYQALEDLSDASIGLGEEAAIEQANLDALDALSSAEVGQGEQEAIDRQALEELSSAEVGLGEQEAIDQAALDFETTPLFNGQTTPFIRDFYISSGRRNRPTAPTATTISGAFGPTVQNLGQALAAPLFPTTPVSGLTSIRGAGEIEAGATGKRRRNVWNEASLRLKDALGI